MNKIRLSDIDFSSLQKLQQQGTKATLYRNGNTCYKILDGLYNSEKVDLYEKFLDMDGIKLDNVLLPKELIMKNGNLYGYTMDYFSDSIMLSDKFGRYIDCKKMFEYVVKASKILRTIHQQNIICQDLSFENILVDKNGNIVFCDLDGCSYKEHISPFISLLMNNFFIKYRGEKILVCSNLDRISMLLSFYNLLYVKEIQNLTEKQYDKLSIKIRTLENLKKYSKILVDKNNSIGEIPYLDEIIDHNDDYICDIKKQFGFVRGMFIK